MIGIFIGIAAVVSLIGLGEGLRNAVIGQFGFLGPDVLTVQASGVGFGPPGQGVVNPLTDDLIDKIQRVPGVETAIGRYIESGTLEFNDRQDVTFAWNVPHGEQRCEFEEMLNLKVEKGRLLKDSDTFKAIIGKNYENSDTFGKEIALGNSVTFNDVKFKVIGVMEKKGSFIFDSALIINEETLLEAFGDDGSVDAIAVRVTDVKAIPAVKLAVEQLLRKERRVKEGEEDFTVQSPENALEGLNQTLFVVQLFITIIAAVSILVGGIGISNTMYTAVLERTKEIGIMKSIGATNSTIFFLFFVESGFLGMLGGAIGVIIGSSLAYLFAFGGQVALGSDLIQAQISLGLVVSALLFSFCVGLIAGLVPAVQAARKNPVDSLRYAK